MCSYTERYGSLQTGKHRNNEETGKHRTMGKQVAPGMYMLVTMWKQIGLGKYVRSILWKHVALANIYMLLAMLHLVAWDMCLTEEWF